MDFGIGGNERVRFWEGGAEFGGDVEGLGEGFGVGERAKVFGSGGSGGFELVEVGGAVAGAVVGLADREVVGGGQGSTQDILRNGLSAEGRFLGREDFGGWGMVLGHGGAARAKGEAERRTVFWS